MACQPFQLQRRDPRNEYDAQIQSQNRFRLRVFRARAILMLNISLNADLTQSSFSSRNSFESRQLWHADLWDLTVRAVAADA